MSYDEPMDNRTPERGQANSNNRTREKLRETRETLNRVGEVKYRETKEALKEASDDAIDAVMLSARNLNPFRPVKSTGYWIIGTALFSFGAAGLLWFFGVVFGLFGVTKVSQNAPDALKNGVQSSSYLIKGVTAVREGVGTTTNVLFSEEQQQQGGWQQQQLPVSIQENPYSYGIDPNSTPTVPYGTSSYPSSDVSPTQYPSTSP